MKPPAFDYQRPAGVEEALVLLHETGEDARVLAGGQSLIAMLSMRLAAPELLVDVSGMAELARSTVHEGWLEVGASVTQETLLRRPFLVAEAPLLAHALPHVGHAQTRSRGTVCGSLCHADPSSELPLCLAVLGGEVRLRSVRGERVLSAAEFQTGMLSTAAGPDELAVASRWPLPVPGEAFAFDEVAMRHGDFAIVAVAAVARADGLRLGVGGVGDRPFVVQWPRLEGEDLADALNELAWHLGADDDPHASARYRRDLVREVGRRTVERAYGWAA